VGHVANPPKPPLVFRNREAIDKVDERYFILRNFFNITIFNNCSSFCISYFCFFIFHFLYFSFFAFCIFHFCIFSLFHFYIFYFSFFISFVMQKAPILYIHKRKNAEYWIITWDEYGYRNDRKIYSPDQFPFYYSKPQATIKHFVFPPQWGVRWQNIKGNTTYKLFPFNKHGLDQALDLAETLIINSPQLTQPRRRRARQSPPESTATTMYDLDANLTLAPLSLAVPQ
jgi:hypothetical protein